MEGGTGERHLKVLTDLRDPKNISGVQLAGKDLAFIIRESGSDKLPWRKLKQQSPRITQRYRAEFLPYIKNGVINAIDLETLSNDTPYRLRFSSWRGSERVFNVSQLVIEIEAYDLLRKLRIGSSIQKKVAGEIDAITSINEHPGRDFCVGWLRIHMDDKNKLCFIDEVQSDVVEHLRMMKLNRKCESETEFVIEVEKYLNSVKDWHIHGCTCLLDWSAEINYKVAIHSRQSANTIKNSMTLSDRKWNIYYKKLIRRYQFIPQRVDSYPESIFVQKY